MSSARQDPTVPGSIAIVGLGLIGGSLARRLSREAWEVGWCDPALDPREVGAECPELRPVDRGDLPDHELVVLATPADVAIDLIGELELGETLVTSVCSVMTPLTRAASERGLRFVAGHPMAGRETVGWRSSDPSLFEGRPWFIDAAAPREPILERMILDCGASPHPIQPSEHDRYVALTSHLPQILSSALAALVEEEEVPSAFQGSGLRTFLRLAGSRWSVWEPIVSLNASEIGRARSVLQRYLDELDERGGEEIFDRANQFYAVNRRPEE